MASIVFRRFNIVISCTVCNGASLSRRESHSKYNWLLKRDNSNTTMICLHWICFSKKTDEKFIHLSVSEFKSNSNSRWFGGNRSLEQPHFNFTHTHKRHWDEWEPGTWRSVPSNHMCGNRITLTSKKCTWERRKNLLFFIFSSTNKMPNGTNRGNEKQQQKQQTINKKTATAQSDECLRAILMHRTRLCHKFATMVMTFVLDKMCLLCVSRRRRRRHHRHRRRRWIRRNRKWHATANMSRLFNTSECRREVQRHFNFYGIYLDCVSK